MEFQVGEILSKLQLGKEAIERQLVQRPWSRKVRVRNVLRRRPSRKEPRVTPRFHPRRLL